jgi:GT2 family glycosyltransferase
MDVSVILVNYKTKDLTTSAIKSVVEKTVGLKYEIFVVDNNSQDGSIEAVEVEFPNIKIIKNSINAGFGAANNIAIKQASGKYILCLNTDTLLINNAIKGMFDYMETNEKVGVCGGNLYDADMTPTMSYASFPNFWNCLSTTWLLKKIFPKLRNHEEVQTVKDVGFITGADIFFRKSVLDNVGIFDEQFFMYYEEADLCKRIKNAGYQIKVIPSAKITHLEGKSAKDFWNNAKLRVKSKYLYARKHQSKITLYSMKFSYVLLHILALIFTFNKENIELIKMHIRG